MKTLFLSALMVLVAASAWASPFMVCDPYPTSATQPTYFEVAIDGGSAVQSTPEAVTGGVRLHYDLASVSSGSHTSTVKACNPWGCSSASSFPFTKGVPTGPSGLRVE